MTAFKTIILISLLQIQLIHCQWYSGLYDPFNPFNAYFGYGDYQYGPVLPPFYKPAASDTEVIQVPNNGNQPTIIIIKDNNNDVAAAERFGFAELLTLLLTNGVNRNCDPPSLPCQGCCCCNNNCGCCNNNCCCCNNNCCCCNNNCCCCNNNCGCCNNANDCGCCKNCKCNDCGGSKTTTHITLVLPNNLFACNKNE